MSPVKVRPRQCDADWAGEGGCGVGWQIRIVVAAHLSHDDLMDAETPKAADLNLPEAFLLMATNDKDGRPGVPVYALRTTLAGAVLAELELIGAIALQGKHVRATGTAPETDFRHELELIRHKSRPHTPKRWVAMLEGRTEVRRVYETMASRGIVEHVGEKHLGLFRTVRYPEKDHGPEAALLDQVAAALAGLQRKPELPGAAESGDAAAPEPAVPETAAPEPAVPEAAEPGAGAPGAGAPPSDAPPPDSRSQGPGPSAPRQPDARTAALIAMLHAAGLLGRLFPAADRVRASEMAKDYWPSRAVEDELRMIRLAEAESPTL